MTTLGWDPEQGLLAADSRTSVNGGHTDTKSKVVLIEPGKWIPWIKDSKGVVTERITAFAGTGTVTTIDLLIHLCILHGEDVASALNMLPDSDYINGNLSGSVLVFTTLAVHEVRLAGNKERKFHRCIRVMRYRSQDVSKFLGSGGSFARAMSVMKLDLVHSMRAARASDECTGGPIRIYKRLESGFFVEDQIIEDLGARADFIAVREAINAVDEKSFPKKHSRLHHNNRVNRELERRSKECKPRARYNWDAEQFEQVKPRNSR